ncbi:undecaprenyl-diphosphate phosphatase [Candidatus Dependentiae bacterium]
MIDAFSIIILIQIILETVPVSSSGHVAIFKHLIKNFAPKIGSSCNGALCELLNLPTVIILALFFRKRLVEISKHLLTSKISYAAYKPILKVIFYAIAANAITFSAYISVPGFFYQNRSILLLGLTFSMLILLSLKFINPNQNHENITMQKAFLIGFAQAFSVIPGVSRFGITYATSRWLNISPKHSFEFSFFLHAMLSGGVLLKGILLPGPFLSLIIPLLSISKIFIIIIASIISYFGLSLSWYLAIKETFWKFGFYYVIPISTLLFSIFAL